MRVGLGQPSYDGVKITARAIEFAARLLQDRAALTTTTMQVREECKHCGVLLEALETLGEAAAMPLFAVIAGCTDRQVLPL